MRSLSLAPIAAVPVGIEVPDVARVQDGVFTRSQARAAGWGDRAQRRMIARGFWIPVAGAVLRHREVPDGPWQAARAVHLTGGLVVSHSTAGRLWQFAVPTDLHGIGHVERRPKHVVPHRLPLGAGEITEVRGLLLTTPARTLADLLCTLDEEAGIGLLTDGFRRGLFGAGHVSAAARHAHGRHGVTRARQLADTCRREPHSMLEWRFHKLCDALGPGWRFNVDIYDEQGFVARVDALHEATGTIVELDGRRFHGEDRFQSDRTRDQRLAALGYVVIRLTWDDLEKRPMEVVERIRRTVTVRARGVRVASQTEPRGRSRSWPGPAA